MHQAADGLKVFNHLKIYTHMTKKSSSSFEPDHWFYLISKIAEILTTAIKWISATLLIYNSIKELAGKETIINVVVEYFSKSSNSWPWILCVFLMFWALGERFFRRYKTAKMSAHMEKLELKIDPNRTSSYLTESGQTPNAKTRSVKM